MSTGAGSAGAVSRPQLPRSASYLTKNRRTQPAAADAGRLSSLHGVANSATPDITPPGTSDDLKAMAHPASVAAAAVHFNAGPVRQSPPPVTHGRTMPMGAIISPPDSQTSSEDEGASREPARGREIENLKELQDAISAIPQHRTSSPDRIPEPGDLLVLPSQIAHLAETQNKNPATRRISHTRSHTEPSIFVSKSADASPTPSEADSEIDDPPQKPIMVRKKSGELVRPALRPAANRRPSSMPGTPTFSKAVHFDSHLEHVRHFLQVDRPLAVSAGSSPNDNYESDTEYPFNSNSNAQSGWRSPPHEWELVIHDFPVETPLRRGMPIRIERLWMSPDQKCLIGSCSVANLAFQKSIVCRFTFDYWKTVSEVTADFSHEIRPRDDAQEGHDRFQFTIKLSDLANLESKTLYFCVRYNVNGTEYWDNNGGLNFQVDFRKKMLPQNGKKNSQGASSRPANSLPRSNRRSNPNTAPRPKSMPVGVMDEFGTDHSMWDDGPLHEFLGESGPIRLKRSSKSTTSLPSDNLTNRLSTPSGLAFANRYDFGASLSAAKQASTGSPRSDGLYMKPHKKASFGPPLQTGPPPAAPSKVAGPIPAPAPPVHMPGPASPASASIATASYEEIVNKYCFVRTLEHHF
jgi:hypothetical protein